MSGHGAARRPSPVAQAVAGAALAGIAALAGHLLCAPAAADGHVDPGSRFGRRIDGQVVFPLTGPTTLAGAIQPRRIKSYVPQELAHGVPFQTWQYTNYSSDRYARYLEIGLWGDAFYDLYGNYLTQGWLLYSFTESHPRVADSSILIGGGGLSSLTIAADQKGANAFAFMIGGGIFTTLTPLTFRKAVYNGTQVHFQSDRVQLTGLFSRISHPSIFGLEFAINEFTNLVGGRALLAVSDQVTVGGVFVNAHNVRGARETFDGNPFRGDLSSSQLERGVESVVIRLTDDSPDDGVGGAVLLTDDVEIITRIAGRDTVILGSQIGYHPRRTGGLQRGGARVADGDGAIDLTYDLEGIAVLLDDRDAVQSIRDLRFRLVLLNDYRVQVTSSQQTNAENQPVFLTVTRAPGNITDASNRKEVVFHYGIPTATEVKGVSLEVRDLFGFEIYSELDVSHDFRKYPSVRYERHRAHSGIRGDRSAVAWVLDVVRARYPWDLSFEAFHLDEDYNTSPYILGNNGHIDYADSTRNLYDFVDDNDDHDRQPDQQRMWQDARSQQELGTEGRSNEGAADPAVFPGWDQNNDFISDFNQNDTFFRRNLVPDYEEPFLRYASDHPDYLFGIDLNNNGWVDSFENDDEPDHPYKRDRRGYNGFLRYHALPGLQLTAGHADERLLTDDRRNRTAYALLAYEREIARRGRVQFFEMLKRARDDIQDDLTQWVQETGRDGGHVRIDDPLFARDAWINTLWLGYDYRSTGGLRLVAKVKHEVVRQGDRGRAAGHGHSRFFGLVNKVDYRFHIGPLMIWPRLKSEYLRDNTPWSLAGIQERREQWTRLAQLHASFPILHRTELQWGLERLHFTDLRPTDGSLKRGDLQPGLRSTVIAGQLENRSDYLGYAMTTLLGISVRRISQDRVAMTPRRVMDSTVFLTVYAGLRD